MYKPLLVVGAGHPGAGKSTLLRRLHSLFPNSFYIDKDAIIDSFHSKDDRSSDHYQSVVRPAVYSIMVALAKDNLKAGRIVLLDSYYANGNQQFRPLLANGTNFCLFRCDASPEVLHGRISARGLARDASKLTSQEAFDKFYRDEAEALDQHLSGITSLRVTDMESQLLKIIDLVERSSY